MRAKALFVLLFVAILAMGMSGCNAPKKSEPGATATSAPAASGSGAAATPTQASQAAQPTVQPTQAQAQPTQTQPTTPQATPTDADTGMELSPMSGLDSYRQHVTMKWEGPNQAMPEMEMLQEFVREPPAQRSVTTMTNDDGSVETMETVRIGDTMYTKIGDDWFASTTEDSAVDTDQYLAWGDPDDFADSGYCKYVGQETIDGLQTKHYSCDQEWFAMSQQNLPADQQYAITLGSVDSWISTQYEVTIKSVMQWVGKDPDGNDVTYTYEAIVYDINAPITINPPEGTEAPALPDDVPMIDGATKVQINSQPPMVIINFEVALPAAEVVAFYEDEMTQEGWTAQDSPLPTMMNFEKDNRTAILMVDEAAGTSTVTLMVGEE